MAAKKKTGAKVETGKHKVPGFFRGVKAEYPDIIQSYEDFARATENVGPLSKREQRLVKLGLTFGAHMEGGAHSAVRKALDAGLTPEEIKHAALLGMTTIGFPNAMACLAWVKDIVEAAPKKG
jgi:alkylhydroperoxidase/carboxymuconolactone decarboxylase family protein YurZ